jgi:hypothetical protein
MENLKKLIKSIRNKPILSLTLGVIVIGLLISSALLLKSQVQQTNKAPRYDNVPDMTKETSKYQAIDYSTVEYKDGEIISPIMPYNDFYSLFSKLPLGHTKATGKGINIGVVSDSWVIKPISDAVYYTARDSEVYTSNLLSIKQLLKHSIDIVVIDNINLYEKEDIIQFVKDCNKENISVVIQGDIAQTDSEIELTNLLEAEGAITVGIVSRQGTTFDIGQNNEPYNRRLTEININIFTSGIFTDLDNTSYIHSLGSIGGALALVLEEKQLSPKELKSHLLENSRNVWQMHSPSEGKVVFQDINVDNVTSQYIPKQDSSIYFYKILDFERLMDIKMAAPWVSNIYNAYRAWDISKGNVDVAIIDQGFHPDAPFLKNNITEAKVFGKEYWNGNFHGTSMAKALLTIAPEAKLHLLLAETPRNESGYRADYIIDALEYCIENKIPIVSLSWASYFSTDEKLINKIQEARDKGITIVWFHYPNNEAGIIKSTFTYFKDESYAKIIFNKGYSISAFDRFIEEDMFYPQEISAGVSCTAPIVAGLAALIKEVNPELTPQEIEELLISNLSSNNTPRKTPAIPDMYDILKKLKNN